MKRSEIFDNFVKIAQEKGLVSNDSSEAKKKLEQTGRADSLDISAIEALYGVRPDASKGMDYKSNIMEVAHPNSVVVSPSYDKLNGLVENNIERQNILLNIVNKPTDGHSTHKKYAEQELIMSLVRIGNDLDNRGSDELRTLADACLMQFSKPIKKEAYAVAIIAGIAALLGGIYLKNHMDFVNDGFEQNHDKLVAELDDLINAGDPTLGVGYKYKPQFIAEMERFKSELETFHQTASSVMPIIEKLDSIQSVDDLKRAANKPEGQEIKRAYDTFKAAYTKFLPSIKAVLKNFASEDYKLRQIEEKGMFSSMVDATQVLHGGKGLVADDFDDVRHALGPYRNSLLNIAKVLREAQSVEKKATEQLQASMSQANTDMPELNPESSSDQAKPESVEDLDQKASQLSKLLGG